MSDKLIRAFAKDGSVRIIAAKTTELVNEGVKIHGCSMTTAAVLGRLLTAGSLMGAMLKSETDKLTIQMAGGGPVGTVVATAYADAHVKGYISNPSVELEPNEKGKLDVGGAVGKNGSLTLIRDLGLKEPYVGRVPIVSGEIGDDLTYYFTISEQTPSAVGLGVLVDKDYSVSAAGGFIIQMMPGADEMIADIITYRLQEIPSITDLIMKGMSIEEIIGYIFEDMDLKIIDAIVPEYRCDCSRERVERSLISIGEKDMREIYEEGKTEEVQCHFCNKKYEFTHEQIGELLNHIK